MHRLVPQFILDNYQTGNYHGSFQAVGLLADVSGFSNMTDALALHGMHGSEILADGMRQVFDPMIQSVLEYGGLVVGFAGDAITALFPLKISARNAYLNAIAAALSIQEYRSDNARFDTPYGQFDITVKIGLGAGEARWGIVSAANSKRATYYFRGSAIDKAVSSLNQSGSNEIILSQNLYQILGSSIHGTRKGECFLLTSYSGKLPAQSPIDLPPPDPDPLTVFCSDEVSAHDLAGEFRPAVNLFIGIPPTIDQEIELASFIQKVFSLQDTYGGLFSRVDIGDKGTNLLMFWGAPIAQENDVERALNFFLELLKESKVAILAGITYRLAYAGYMGGILQEEYTCYGWGVSLSARLMTAAKPGEIWADEEIARRAGQRFSFQYVGKQKFKGFSKEQNVFKLLKRKEDDRAIYTGEFVGRKSELVTLGRFIDPIWSGQFAGMLTVTGEPGIGKSRLIDTFQSSEIFTGQKSYWAVCQTDDIVHQSLNPFRYWLKRYFNVFESVDETKSKRVFDEKLDQLTASIPDHELSNSLRRLGSFLGTLINLHWPDSLYEKMDAQGRYDNTFIALSMLLRGESLRQPIIVLIEDAHLLDSDSRAFLLYLERALTADAEKSYPIALIATARREGSGIELDRAPNEEIVLVELASSDLIHLAANHLDGVAAPSLLEILKQRTEGNPFFIEQIIRYLREEGKLEKGPNGWQITGEETIEALPTDINAILIARLDRLNHEVREVIQTASVIGREFELRLLSKMLREDKTLIEKVNLGVETKILSALTEIRYIFRHALLRDAAYTMQLETRKQELHQIAVEAFEAVYHDQLPPYYYEIAYHASRARLKEKAKKFYILAGEYAAQAYQNIEAIESYTHALALGSIVEIQERIELLLARVALFRIVGDSAGQEQDLATLELLTEKKNDKHMIAVVALQRALLAFDLGEFQEAQRITQSAIEMAESVHALDVAANAYRTLPLALARQGKIKEAIRFAKMGLQLAQRLGDQESEGQVLNDLGLIILEQRELDQARDYFEKSLLIAQETGNRRLEAQVLNNMGKISGMIENDYTSARRFFEKTLEIAREIGNRIGEGYALGNLGWAASMGGDFEQARDYFIRRLTVARESDNHSAEAYGLINLGAMMISQEIYSDALEYEEQALNLARKIGDPSAEAWALTYLGYANLGLGDFKEATHMFQMALDIRYTLDQQTLAMEPLAGLAQVELGKDDPGAALTHVETILSHLQGGGNLEGTEEPLRVYLVVYLTLMKNRDPRTNQVLENAYSLLRKQVSKIQEQAHKEMFIRNVPWRQQIEELWQQKHATKKRDI